MARSKREAANPSHNSSVDQIFRDNVNNIIPVDLEDEMKKSFIDYAMSVITDRALPDVRDGLKPVHRRILYSMYTQGFTPDKAYRKCATTVGDVLGRFHPHGDAAVYDALVRLAQDFSMRHMLVDGHGNFGSRDGDPPAAYRYTEARLTRIALDMMSDINKNTVDFQPNFDEHEMEPSVLPARFPNLLVNGSTGIAVGMATNVPPHNLRQTVDATIYLMHHAEADINELMEIIEGPDFPTGGIILGQNGLREMYMTGHGRFEVRSHTEIEEFGHNRHRIVVHDLPYQVNKARLIEKIDQLVKEKRLDGISLVRDESDRKDPVRIMIELKSGANPNVVLNQLFRNTQLQDAFNANLLALVPTADGRLEPQLINLRQALQYYVDHQKDVVTRRTRFDLEKTEARRHIVEGLLKAIDHIDEVIAIIRSSRTEDLAKSRLSERFGFSDRQSQHIVDMRLGRLTGLEREKLTQEYQDLTARIEYLTSILADDAVLLQVIEKELRDVADRNGDDRRTELDPFADDEITDESLLKEETVVVTLTHFGYVKRLPAATYQMQHRGGRGISGMQTREEDFVERIIITSTHDYLLFFTNWGRVYMMKAYRIPESSRQTKGMAIVNLLQLNGGEKIQTVIPVHEFNEDGYLFFATARGQVKKTALPLFANINRAGLIAISLMEEDRLINVAMTEGSEDVILATAQGQSIRFSEHDVRAMGRDTQGVRGIRLRPKDELIGMVTVQPERDLLVVSQNGYGKRSSLEDYRLQSRGGTGILTYKVSERTGPLVAVSLVKDEQDLILINDAGVIIRLAAEEIPLQGRATQGVTLMRSHNGTVVDAAVVDRDETDAAVVDRDEADAAVADRDEADAAVVDRDEALEDTASPETQPDTD